MLTIEPWCLRYEIRRGGRGGEVLIPRTVNGGESGVSLGEGHVWRAMRDRERVEEGLGQATVARVVGRVSLTGRRPLVGRIGVDWGVGEGRVRLTPRRGCSVRRDRTCSWAVRVGVLFTLSLLIFLARTLKGRVRCLPRLTIVVLGNNISLNCGSERATGDLFTGWMVRGVVTHRWFGWGATGKEGFDVSKKKAQS